MRDLGEALVCSARPSSSARLNKHGLFAVTPTTPAPKHRRISHTTRCDGNSSSNSVEHPAARVQLNSTIRHQTQEIHGRLNNSINGAPSHATAYPRGQRLGDELDRVEVELLPLPLAFAHPLPFPSLSAPLLPAFLLAAPALVEAVRGNVNVNIIVVGIGNVDLCLGLLPPVLRLAFLLDVALEREQNTPALRAANDGRLEGSCAALSVAEVSVWWRQGKCGYVNLCAWRCHNDIPLHRKTCHHTE